MHYLLHMHTLYISHIYTNEDESKPKPKTLNLKIYCMHYLQHVHAKFFLLTCTNTLRLRTSQQKPRKPKHTLVTPPFLPPLSLPHAHTEREREREREREEKGRERGRAGRR